MKDAETTFVVIYGPPASGKLTVATELAKLTSFKLFHNHLTVNLVRSLFEFSSPEFNRTLWKIRLDLLSEAARSETSVIITLNSAHGPPTFEARARQLELAVESHGARIVFVHLEPSREVLHERLSDPSRAAHEKLRIQNA